MARACAPRPSAAAPARLVRMCTLLLCPPSTGERNGFTVLTEEEFYDFHLTTPDLSVMLIRVGRESGGLPSPSPAHWLLLLALGQGAGEMAAACPASLPPNLRACVRACAVWPCAGQGQRRDGDVLHGRARGRHAHAHVVRHRLRQRKEPLLLLLLQHALRGTA